MAHPFEMFLDQFMPPFEKKATQVNKAAWILETTSSADAADLKADLEEELRLMLQSPSHYQALVQWSQDPKLQDPLLKRQLNVLLRAFKQNQISKEMIRSIAEKEAKLGLSYGQFRPLLNGHKVSENEIREILKKERDVQKRKAAWCASKEIGKVLAPQILELVDLRNEAARSLGYPDFFVMQLELQEVDEKWLMHTLQEISSRSEGAYGKMLEGIKQQLASCFQVAVEEVGPWSFSDPFFQEDPVGTEMLDELVEKIDMLQSVTRFYDQMGFDVKGILSRSDNEERPGKNQHAFCIHIDRRGDVRTLNNVKKTIKWLETVLHELGHAVYELGFDPALPWLLREPPHMIPTEAMALIAGRQAYKADSLALLAGPSSNPRLLAQAEESLKRRQLIFSRWVFVMTHFEKELYANPRQDLNRLWWQCVKKYQKITPPEGREGACDWAAKYHIGLAPVYYFSYLIGEVFASAIEEAVHKEKGKIPFCAKETGAFLQEKLFQPGDRMNWNELISSVTGAPLSIEPWLNDFAR